MGQAGPGERRRAPTHFRKRIDISWPELATLWRYALTAVREDRPTAALQQLWSAGALCLPVYSVRSALDLFLRAQRYPPGSVAIVTAITIPDMVLIQEEHGLEVVAVDLDRDTLAPDAAELERLLAEHGAAVVFVLHAHLFGARAPLDEVARLTRAHGVLLLEDCAQAFDGSRHHGHPESDLVLWSFGPVKTATCLAGGIVVGHARRAELVERMRAVQQTDPVLARADYLRRLARYTALHLLTSPVLFPIAVGALVRAGRDPEQVIVRQTRSFPSAAALLSQLRRRPHPALLRAMLFRQSRYPQVAVAQRAAAAAQLLDAVPDRARLGGRAERHTHWLAVVVHPDPQALLAVLRSSGVDAGLLSASLAVARPPSRSGSHGSAELLRHAVHVPAAPQLPPSERARTAALLRAAFD